jgi:outer membrane autotransporter protein
MKRCPRLAFAILWLIFLSGMASAADLGPNYSDSVRLSIDHAANPAGWRPESLFVIRPDAPVSQGLTYDGGRLIVRTATKSRNFKSNHVGQANYRIYGLPTTEASWVTTGNDATKFILAKGVTGANATKLLERGLGMDATGTHDAVVEFAADTQYLMRPTRNPDIAQYLPAAYGANAPFTRPAGMSDEAFNNFKAYYENWLAGAYGPYPFPWTQLGYTFFWGNGYTLDKINGMSEFILLGGSPVEIYGIYATQSYIYTRNDGAGFSSAAGASYGNGFASFKVDGSCDTVWAGHRFQKNVRADAATPNQILVENGGSISGGQGVLVWSLNYDVVNSGIISGATADKYGIAGTANIAVLFKGDTGADYGLPVTAGVNRLTNTGTISSPGTAVKAEAGNTLITNNAGGRISGGNYAIQTGAGNDAVTVNGGEIAGNIDLGGGADTLMVTGAGNAKLTFVVGRDTAASARVANVETVTIADNTTLAVRAAGTGNIRDNDRYLIVDAQSLTVNPAGITIRNEDALPMITFSAEKNGNRLSLLTARDNGYYRTNSGNASLGAVLDSLANTATGDMSAVIGVLDGSGSAENAGRLGPVADQGTIQASYGTVGQFNQTVMNRIDQVLAGRTGMTGSESARQGAWAQGFGAYLYQGARGTSDGYDARALGVSFGYDTFFFKHVLAGFGTGYARNNITTKDAATRTDADSYQGNVYGSFARDDYYINAVLAFAYNRYDASRHIAFGAVDRAAKSDYAGRQYSGCLEGGYTVKNYGVAVTPLVSLQYMRLHLDGYTETNAGDLNLTVESQNYNLFQTGLGAKLAYPIAVKKSRIIPEMHLKWLYDFAGDRQRTTAQFTGGGASFATEGFDPAQSSYNVGARLTVLMKSNVTVALSYDFEKKEDFSGHRGYIHLQFAF